MSNPRIISCLLLTCLGHCGCTSQDQALPGDVTTALESAFNRNDAAAVAALYADDAELLLQDGPTLKGRTAIETFYRDEVARDISFDSNSTWSVIRGDLAFEQGTYKVRNVSRGQDVETGKYMHFWKKANGTWELYRHIFNSDSGRYTDVDVLPAEDGPG